MLDKLLITFLIIGAMSFLVGETTRLYVRYEKIYKAANCVLFTSFTLAAITLLIIVWTP